MASSMDSRLDVVGRDVAAVDPVDHYSSSNVPETFILTQENSKEGMDFNQTSLVTANDGSNYNGGSVNFGVNLQPDKIVEVFTLPVRIWDFGRTFDPEILLSIAIYFSVIQEPV